MPIRCCACDPPSPWEERGARRAASPGGSETACFSVCFRPVPIDKRTGQREFPSVRYPPCASSVPHMSHAKQFRGIGYLGFRLPGVPYSQFRAMRDQAVMAKLAVAVLACTRKALNCVSAVQRLDPECPRQDSNLRTRLRRPDSSQAFLQVRALPDGLSGSSSRACPAKVKCPICHASVDG